MKKSGQVLSYSQEASYWEAALPLGNGRIGAMVYGGAEQEKIALNEDSLWSGLPENEYSKEFYESLPEARRMIAERKFSEASKFVSTHMGDHDSQSYLPAGTLTLNIQNPGAVSGYARSLDLSTALFSLEYKAGNTACTREAFVSCPAQVLVYRLKAEGNAGLNFKAEFSSPVHGKSVSENKDIAFDGECPVYDRRDEIIWKDENGNTGIRYRMQLHVELKNGEAVSENGILTVRNADEAVLYLAIRSNFKDWKTMPHESGIDYRANAAKDIEAAVKAGYDKLKADHTADHNGLFARSVLEFPELEGDSATLPERLDAGKDAALFHPNLAALLYNFGRYLMIASSRQGTQVTNLQGIWNHLISPPWGCNYTTNINTEMNYWPAENTNLADCAGPMFDFIRDLAEKGRNAARELYHANGWCLHHNSDLWRYCSTATGNACWLYWPVCGGWLCRHLMDHYRYSLNKEFLKEAEPIIRGSAAFFLDLMIEERDGTLTTSPSTSPENHFVDPATGEGASTASGIQMDMSIIRETLESVLECADVLGTDDDFTSKVKSVLPKLKKPAIGPAGQLLEYGENFEETDIHHRHASHLYGVYPGAEFTTERNREYFHAAKISLLRRGDMSTGWAMGWRVVLWARFLDGDHACRVIRNLLTPVYPKGEPNYMAGGGVYANLFDAHPPFQIDGNFGVTAGIGEMFVQSHKRTPEGKTIIEIFPALPSFWTEGRINGLRAQGDLTIDLNWNKDGYTAAISAGHDGDFVFRTPNGVEEKSLKAGEKLVLS